MNSHLRSVYSLTASKNLIACGLGLGFYIVCNTNSPSNCQTEAIPRINPNDPQSSSMDYTINYMVPFTITTPHMELLIASNDYYCRMIDINTFKYTYEFKDRNPINCASLRNDGKTLLVVGDDTITKLIDINSNKEIQRIDEHYICKP
ncbi:hypothetical protein PIROE2DRAFT_4414 [Piromyces sp. E2]|nr:hypothetical protein PIROE2DRAFT_4414 [Piromyces sp. E2]|eukprot:OUM67995.1 hypothetical protein PIROE2DRAFT_4414 [Piromyces sp. E2]